MIVELETKMRSLDGLVLQDRDRNGNAQDITVRAVLIEALLRPHVSEDRMTGIEKLRRFELARNIYGFKGEGGKINFSAEEVVLLKEVVGSKNFPVLIVGQMFGLLEGKE